MAKQNEQQERENEVLFTQGFWRVIFGGKTLQPEWRSRCAAETCLDLLYKGQGTVQPDGRIEWLPEVHEPLLTLEERKRTIYETSNLLQSIMGYLELGNVTRARATLVDALQLLSVLRDSIDEENKDVEGTKKNPAPAR